MKSCEAHVITNEVCSDTMHLIRSQERPIELKLHTLLHLSQGHENSHALTWLCTWLSVSAGPCNDLAQDKLVSKQGAKTTGLPINPWLAHPCTHAVKVTQCITSTDQADLSEQANMFTSVPHV